MTAGDYGEDEDDLPLETLYLSRAHLTRFLEDPQSGWAEALLGVTRADDEEAEESLEDEPFEPSGLTKVVALRVAGAAVDQRLVGAVLDHLPALDHQDPIGHAHRREAVRDQERRAARRERAEALEDRVLGRRVQRGRRLGDGLIGP